MKGVTVSEVPYVQELVDVDPEQASEGALDPPVVEEQPAPPPDDVGDLEVQVVEGDQALRAVALALGQQGMREQPCPTNRNPYSTYFGHGPEFWCADFVAWCFDRTGNQDKKVPWGYPSAVRNITAWAQNNRLIVGAPQRGDIFTYRNGAHTGLVTAAGGGTFSTVEGNTTGPDGTSCWVAQHKRSTTDGRYYFVRWPW